MTNTAVSSAMLFLPWLCIWKERRSNLDRGVRYTDWSFLWFWLSLWATNRPWAVIALFHLVRTRCVQSTFDLRYRTSPARELYYLRVRVNFRPEVAPVHDLLCLFSNICETWPVSTPNDLSPQIEGRTLVKGHGKSTFSFKLTIYSLIYSESISRLFTIWSLFFFCNLWY